MRTPASISARTLRTLAAIVLTLSAVAVISCAYYNTLYNAKQRYKEVSKQPVGRDGKPTRAQLSGYDEVIEKCQTMIVSWPESRHVDDAMLLIAECLYAQQRYGECVAELDSLEIRFPDTELLPDVRFLKGKALADWEEDVEAIQVLKGFIDKYPRSRERPQALSYLATSSIRLGREDDAVRYVDELEKKYSKKPITFQTQLKVGRILAEKGNYEDSRSVYEALNNGRVPLEYRFDVWMGLAQAYVSTGEYNKALEIIDDVETLVLTREEEPEELLLKAKAYAGLDSTRSAVAVYRSVTRRFSRGRWAAEANFRLGEIYEAADSLEQAKVSYDGVARAYSGSEFASEAIRRSGSIAKLMRLEQMQESDSPEAQALREFSLAELQLTQFNNVDRALELYEALVHDFPESEWAPKAVYATGYIYGIMRGDTLRARQAHDLLQSRYPNTQQAQFAYLFVPGMSPPETPPGGLSAADAVLASARVDSLRSDSLSVRFDSTAVDTSGVQRADTTRTVAASDTTRTTAPPDTTAAPAPPDTTATAAPDTTGSSADADTTDTAKEPGSQ